MRMPVAVMMLMLMGCSSSASSPTTGDSAAQSADSDARDSTADLPGPVDAMKDSAAPLDQAVPVDARLSDMPLDLPAELPPADLQEQTAFEAVTEIQQEVQADLGPDLPLTVGEMCFPEVYVPGEPGPDYDQFDLVVGDHCFGTNHQTIIAVERVVFLGDSVTVGTPNLAHLLSVDNNHFYRNKLATWLASHFNLDTGNLWDWGLWKTYDYFTGKGSKWESGDFRHCGYWGARTDDLVAGGGQILECFPEGGSSERTLTIFTLGGNDIAKITQTGAEATAEEVAAGYPASWALAQDAVMHLENGVSWLKDPVNFPFGSYVIFGNGFEFTDATGQTSACNPQAVLDIPGIGEIDLNDLGIPVALLAGYGEWEKPEVLADIVIWLLEQYMRIAVDYGADVIWTVEEFCGHGYVAAGANADPDNRCYIGPDAQLYFDETCIHPSPAGHNALFEMFKAVILE